MGAAKTATANAGFFPGLDQLRGDFMGALVVGVTVLPSCIAAGVIAFGPLGPQFAASGIAAAFSALVFGGFCVAALSSSSFIVNAPQTSVSVVQASFIVTLLAHPAFRENPALAIAAFSACVVVTGLLIALIGVSGVASILKYTPHPVLAGFRNGIVASQLWQQIKPYLDFHFQQPGPLPFIAHGQQFAIVLALALAIALFDRFARKVPAPVLGIALGAIVFYLARSYAPWLEVGRTVGAPAFDMPPPVPLLQLADVAARDAVISVAREIGGMALVLAMLVTLQSLPVYRLAKNQIDTPIDPSRNLVALGVGNCLSGLVGGLVLAAKGSQGNTAFRNGGRTRWVGIFLALFYLLVATLAPSLLALIPLIAISAVVIQNSAEGFDAWTTGLLKRVLAGGGAEDAVRARADLLVVGVVMFATVGVSELLGLALGVALACLIFIIEMSRPLVRRELSGLDMTSKRVRDGAASTFLRETGAQRVVFELHGVLFFGNTESLSDRVLGEASVANTILLDLRGVTDIDASGEAIITTMMERLRKSKKQLLFCNVPASMQARIRALASNGKMPAPFPDLDTALEWMEERALASRAIDGPDAEVELRDHDLVRGLDEKDLNTLRTHLERVTFAAGTHLCEQGDPGDRMWLLAKGVVSVRIKTGDARGSRRVASLAKGTTVGEMAVIEQSRRSATLTADEEVVAFALSRESYESLLLQHPAVVTRLFGNLLRELASRIRDNHLELREAVG